MATTTLRDAGQRMGALAGAPPASCAEEAGEGGRMTLIEHLGELRHRLVVALIAVAVCSVAGFVFWERLLDFLTTPLPTISSALRGGGTGGEQKLITTQIGGGFVVALKLAVAAGIALASPVILYQLWAFLSPALTRRERKYARPFTLLGTGLFAAGIALGYAVLRFPVQWLIDFGKEQFVYLIAAGAYFTFVAYFLLAFGVVFELPLVLTFLSVVGVVNSRILRRKRMHILFGLWVLSCFITPGADPYSPVIIGASLTLLFELTILLMRVIGK